MPNINRLICGDALQNIFTIPAGIPFAKALASSLLEEHASSPEALPDILILLPTRRACRTLREAFLQLNAGKPIMLPRMQALGDIDEEELSLSIAGAGGTQKLTELKPVLPNMQRQILLARAVQKHEDFPHGFDQALALAKTLTQLIDQIHTENLDIKDLADLVPEDFADHWKITLDFLKILSEIWPQILDDMGMIDAAKRRNLLINSLADFWQETKPTQRVIAAGTTGSIPSTAHLLNVIANLPNGQIILPGLDEYVDEESWESLSESHPQYGFKHLLGYMNILREDVALWPNAVTDSGTSKARRKLASELMRPTETTKAWQSLEEESFDTAIRNLSLYEADTPQQEAQIIASLMRSILEEPTKTAALITPDRNLAKRVAMACRRWNIEIDDSAGSPLTQTPLGRFLMLSIEACAHKLSPVSLLALLKHPLTHQDLKAELRHFARELLRGTKPPAGIEGLKHQATKAKAEKLTPFIEQLETLFSPLLAVHESEEKQDFKTLLHAHISLCEALHSDESLWAGEDGNAASALLSELLEQAGNFPQILATEYPQILQQFLSNVTLRPAYGTHPRLQILGQLEARLIDADLVILGGLNAGTWPHDQGHDPWMSRPMRAEFGLPASDRSIGLAAHDFIQGLCTPNVAMTRAKLVNGAPTVPARWLQRLDTVMTAARTDTGGLTQNDMMHWVKEIDTATTLEPYTRPAPKPPRDIRPRKMAITKIETWLKDPYSIYAHSILNLRTLDPLEKESDAAIRGQILHDTLDDFITQYPDTIPKDAEKNLLQTAQNFVQEENLTEEDWNFYWPRFTKITQQFLDKESGWREGAKPLKTEIKGQINLTTQSDDFTLYGRADRIDQTSEGAAIIDYKSGGYFSKKGMESGDIPQLPLEALILQDGGFEGIAAGDCNYLGYWVLNGNNKHTELTEPHDMLVDTKEALTNLIDTFDNEDTPYYAIPRASKTPRFNDYEHLARTKEWAALDDEEAA